MVLHAHCSPSSGQQCNVFGDFFDGIADSSQGAVPFSLEPLVPGKESSQDESEHQNVFYGESRRPYESSNQRPVRLAVPLAQINE